VPDPEKCKETPFSMAYKTQLDCDIYADDERRTEVFNCIYIHNIKKEAMN